jgi:hypothetical protein
VTGVRGCGGIVLGMDERGDYRDKQEVATLPVEADRRGEFGGEAGRSGMS